MPKGGKSRDHIRHPLGDSHDPLRLNPMKSQTKSLRSAKSRLDAIPDFVLAAAVKGIRKALREIVHDRRVSRLSIDNPVSRQNHA